MDGRIVASKWFGEAKKTGDAEYKKALKWEEDRRAQLEKEQEETPTTSSTEHESVPTLRSWGNQYLFDVQRRCTSKTYHEKRRAFGRISEHVSPDDPVTAITKKIALAFLTAQHDARSGYAANKDRKNLATAWSWGAKYLDSFPQDANPFLVVERFPEQRDDRYVPPEEDFWAAFRCTPSDSQDRVMLTTFLHLAARKSEIFRLQWHDIDWAQRQARLYTRKTRDGSWEFAYVPMTEELARSLSYWWEHRPHKHSSYVFTIIGGYRYERQLEGQPFSARQHFMRKLCETAGVKPFGFHAIRHLSAVILFHAGYSLAIIQSILRHKNPSTTERYLKRLGLDPNSLHQAVSVFEGRHTQGRVITMGDVHGGRT